MRSLCYFLLWTHLCMHDVIILCICLLWSCLVCPFGNSSAQIEEYDSFFHFYAQVLNRIFPWHILQAKYVGDKGSALSKNLFLKVWPLNSLNNNETCFIMSLHIPMPVDTVSDTWLVFSICSFSSKKTNRFYFMSHSPPD